MKKVLLVLLLTVLLFALCSCSGVITNAKYSALIDRTVAYSDVMAEKAEKGELTKEQMVKVLKWQAGVWHAIKDAKDGKAGGQ
ncbi:MAG: hypothetical protein DRN20_00460 [Thermoplasmata archaeon]|nr:MAG: hypothetical protein DRN20_00460 [Thermoplasmata archaeon]